MSTVPKAIRLENKLQLPVPRTESEALEEIRRIGKRNTVKKSFIGMGYHGTYLPSVIQRNVLENPGWYTAYTPYQAEIAQGRLQALLNFQTMITDMTGMAISNASLLDESSAAAEAMSMSFGATNGKRNKFYIANDCHPQTIALCQVRNKIIRPSLR